LSFGSGGGASAASLIYAHGDETKISSTKQINASNVNLHYAPIKTAGERKNWSSLYALCLPPKMHKEQIHCYEHNLLHSKKREY